MLDIISWLIDAAGLIGLVGMFHRALGNPRGWAKPVYPIAMVVVVDGLFFCSRMIERTSSLLHPVSFALVLGLLGFVAWRHWEKAPSAEEKRYANS